MKRVVAGEVHVVAQPDEALGIADELVRQRQPEGAVERIEDEPADEHEEREQEEERGAGVAAARAPPPGGARPDGAGYRSVIDGHVTRAGCRRRP
jgi:hypothetical protein